MLIDYCFTSECRGFTRVVENTTIYLPDKKVFNILPFSKISSKSMQPLV